ncbi:MAG: hypothetical protein ABIL58_23410 [Pseudomonadota bacterium]
MRTRSCSFIAVLLIAVMLAFSTIASAAWVSNPWTGGQYPSGPKYQIKLEKLEILNAYLYGTGTFYGASPLVFEGATYDDYQTTFTITDPTADRVITFPNASGTVALNPAAGSIEFEGDVANNYETTLAVEEPTADRTITLPDYTGGIPIVVQQGYTQFSHSEATTVDVTGAALTLPDGWFTEGKAFRVKAGGTVTGTNGVVTVALYLEDGAVCSLTTGTAAAGDWTAEFIIVATGAATQRIIGTLVAGAGADPISDYAADTTDTAAAGTIPLKLQVGLANAADVITAEYWVIEHWSKAD